jgi:hypothetical protein
VVDEEVDRLRLTHVVLVRLVLGVLVEQQLVGNVGVPDLVAEVPLVVAPRTSMFSYVSCSVESRSTSSLGTLSEQSTVSRSLPAPGFGSTLVCHSSFGAELSCR